MRPSYCSVLTSKHKISRSPRFQASKLNNGVNWSYAAHNPMSQPRITAKITFLGASDGGRDVLPANLVSGQYRPHIVIDPNQPTAVAIDNPEETHLGVAFENVPAQILPGQPFLADLVLIYWPNIKYEGLVPGATFTIREGTILSAMVVLNPFRQRRTSEHGDEEANHCGEYGRASAAGAREAWICRLG